MLLVEAQNRFRQLLSRSIIGSNEILCFLILITPLYLTYFVTYLFGSLGTDVEFGDAPRICRFSLNEDGFL